MDSIFILEALKKSLRKRLCMENWNIYNRTYKEDTKKFHIITDNTIKCKCGHSVLMGKNKRIICTHCGKWVFKSKLDEFKYRFNEIRIKIGD